MSKDRLDHIKERREIGYSINPGSTEIQQFDLDFDWLIEQAERAQELDGFLNKADEYLVKNGKKIMKLTDEKAELEYQNKRLHEAIESIENFVKGVVFEAFEGDPK